MPKISQLAEVQTVNDADNFIIEQGGETVRAATTTLTDALNAQISQGIADVNNAVTQAQSAVSQAQRAVSALPDLQLTKTFYVDEINGSDLNDGGLNTPLKNISYAISLIPSHGSGHIILKSDVVLNGAEIVDINLEIGSYGQKRKVTLTDVFSLVNSELYIGSNYGLTFDLGTTAYFNCYGAKIFFGGYYNTDIDIDNSLGIRKIFYTTYNQRGKSTNYVSFGRGNITMTDLTNIVYLFQIYYSGAFYVDYFQVVWPGSANFIKTNETETLIGSGQYLYGV